MGATAWRPAQSMVTHTPARRARAVLHAFSAVEQTPESARPELSGLLNRPWLSELRVAGCSGGGAHLQRPSGVGGGLIRPGPPSLSALHEPAVPCEVTGPGWAAGRTHSPGLCRAGSPEGGVTGRRGARQTGGPPALGLPKSQADLAVSSALSRPGRGPGPVTSALCLRFPTRPVALSFSTTEATVKAQVAR